MSMNCMVDLETVGQRFDAPIISIGAVFFDPDTGEFGPEFYRAIDPENAFRFGRPSGDTMKWWMRQSDSARQAAMAGTISLEAALNDLTAFYRTHPKAPIWGNGPSFDVTIMEHAYWQVFRAGAPWAFWNIRDCRTILELGEALGYSKPLLKGTAHNALDDARHQAQWVCEIRKLILNRQVKKIEPAPPVSNSAPSDFDDIDI